MQFLEWLATALTDHLAKEGTQAIYSVMVTFLQ